MSIEFLITSLVVVVAPGTGVLYTLSTGLTRGARASLFAAFGCTLGIVPHILAAVTGLAAILHASAVAFDALKYVGVAYLLYMAWMTLRERGALRVDPAVSPRSAARIVVRAILINILNPKLSIFFLAFLPQFIAVDAAHPVADMAGLGAVFMAMTFAVFVLYGLFAAAVRDRLLSRPAVMAWMRRAFAAAFVGLGVRLALTGR